MQPSRSLKQLMDDPSSPSNLSSDESDLENNDGIRSPLINISFSPARTQNRTNHPSTGHYDQYFGYNLLETASSTRSEASIDGERARGIIWNYGGNRNIINQPLRVNARLIYKDYCKAMVKFNIQSLSEPYLREYITSKNIDIDSFKNYIRVNERNVKGLNGLGTMIMPKATDTEECKTYKIAFKMGCEAFLKYFAVNWVFAANIRNTQSYLKHRFRLLRKIRDLSF